MLLENIRSWAHSWLMTILLVLIIVPFAFWGINQYFEGGGPMVVAEVNDSPIGIREYQQTLQQQRYRLQAALGGGIELDEAAEAQLKRETLNQMIQEAVLVDRATGKGMTVGDHQLAALIHAQEAFQASGQFSRERYEAWLRRQGYAPEGFEQSFRRSLVMGQLQLGVAGTAFLTAPERARLERLQGQKRQFSYLTVRAARYLDQVQVTEAQIRDYYRDHEADFQQPEQVDAEYVEVSREGLAARVEVAEEDLRQRYESHRGSYGVPEQRRARHILLQLAEDADAQTVDAVTAKARDLVARLKAGEPFDDLARQLSEDPGSAAAGGDLGLFARGTMVQPFEDAVFALKAGEISEPVRSPFGVHVIRVDAVQAGSARPFEEVRAEILREAQLERSEPQFFEQAERLANLAFEHPDSLEPAAEALGLTVRSTGFFSRKGGDGPAAESRFVAAAFGDEVLRQGHNSSPVELRDGRVLVLRAREVRPAVQRTLEEVRGEILERVRALAAAQQAEATAQTLMQGLRGGADRAELARGQGLEWVEVAEAGRQGGETDSAITSRVFQLPRPAAGYPVLATATLANGDAAVIALKAVVDGETAGKAAGASPGTRFDPAYGRLVYDALVDTVRAGADVRVYQDRL